MNGESRTASEGSWLKKDEFETIDLRRDELEKTGPKIAGSMRGTSERSGQKCEKTEQRSVGSETHDLKREEFETTGLKKAARDRQGPKNVGFVKTEQRNDVSGTDELGNGGWKSDESERPEQTNGGSERTGMMNGESGTRGLKSVEFATQSARSGRRRFETVEPRSHGAASGAWSGARWRYEST